MDISIVGVGYVGLVTGLGFADKGHKVIAVDVDTAKINQIKSGISPFYEDGIDDLLKKYIGHSFIATTDMNYAIANSDVSFVCVGTPSMKDGSIDLEYIKSSVKQIARVLSKIKKYHILIIKSTILPGTIEDVVIPLLEGEGLIVGKDVNVAFNPEFLSEGNAINNFLHPDRVILGTNKDDVKKIVNNLYSDFDTIIFNTTIKTAEIIKYVSNSFLATKISFANEIGNLCKCVGVNPIDVFKGVGLDYRINPSFFGAGVGFGGSCFKKDINALINLYNKFGEPHHLLDATLRVNKVQPLKLIKILKKYIPNLSGKTIGILGLSFKPGTDDIRESRAIPVVKELLKYGVNIVAYDPKAIHSFSKLFPNINYVTSSKDVLSSDAVLIVTEWEEFNKLDFSGCVVIDGRGVKAAKLSARVYEGVCW